MSHPDQPTLSDGLLTLRPTAVSDDRLATFVVEHDGTRVGEVGVTIDGGLHWELGSDHRGHGYATRAVRVLADWSLADGDQGGLGLRRIQARVDARDDASLRVATRSGLRREGTERVATGTDRDVSEYVVLARLADDPPLSDPASFRALLNSFLPRKRAISQLLVRDHDGRVLVCQLTYKRDWDLPGGVVEVGESPHLAAGREVAEELALDITPGRLVLTDWLPPWGGWDDAICLVFDGGVHDASIVADVVRQEREIRDAQFLAPEQVRELAADFTARRIESALANLDGGTAYTESGRPL